MITRREKEKFEDDERDPAVGAILSQVVREDVVEEVTFR